MSLLVKIKDRSVNPASFSKIETLTYFLKKLPLLNESHTEAAVADTNDGLKGILNHLLQLIRPLSRSSTILGTREYNFQCCMNMIETFNYIFGKSTDLDVWFFAQAVQALIDPKYLNFVHENFNVDERSYDCSSYEEFKFCLVCVTLPEGHSIAQKQLKVEFGLDPVPYYDYDSDATFDNDTQESNLF